MSKLAISAHLLAMAPLTLLLLYFLGNYIMICHMMEAGGTYYWNGRLDDVVKLLILCTFLCAPSLAYVCFHRDARKRNQKLSKVAFLSYLLSAISPAFLMSPLFIVLLPSDAFPPMSDLPVYLGGTLFFVSACCAIGALVCSGITFHRIKKYPFMQYGKRLASLGAIVGVLDLVLWLGVGIWAAGL